MVAPIQALGSRKIFGIGLWLATYRKCGEAAATRTWRSVAFGSGSKCIVNRRFVRMFNQATPSQKKPNILNAMPLRPQICFCRQHA